VTTPRLCQNCREAKVLSTGSTLFYLCPKDGCYRSVADVCNLIEKPLISLFLGRLVTAEVERGSEIEGKLIRYEFGSKNNPHKPNILILENDGKLIIRGNWIALKTVERVVKA